MRRLRLLRSLPAAATIVMLVLAIWTVVPAPFLILLPLAVAVPEFATPLLAVDAVLLAIGMTWSRGTSRRVCIATGGAALILLGWVPVAAAIAGNHADASLRAANIATGDARATWNVVETRDIPVRLRDGNALALDLYRPQGRANPPVIITIYGGAWIFGARANDAPLARSYARRGFAVIVVDYRHAPQYRFPTQRDDIEDALAAIAHDAGRWGIDASRVALFGRSAGGQLALVVGERPQPVHVCAIVAYYAPTDLLDGWNRPPIPDPIDTKRALRAYLGTPDAESQRYRAASPIEAVRANMPPVLTLIGDRDDVVRVEQQRRFVARLAAAGVPHVAVELPWANHAFDAVDGPGKAIADRLTVAFLRARLDPK